MKWLLGTRDITQIISFSHYTYVGRCYDHVLQKRNLKLRHLCNRYKITLLQSVGARTGSQRV